MIGGPGILMSVAFPQRMASSYSERLTAPLLRTNPKPIGTIMKAMRLRWPPSPYPHTSFI